MAGASRFLNRVWDMVDREAEALKACLLAAGGCVNLFRPRSVGEGPGRAWYPVWNAGSTYAMAAQAGAELTMMENRFVATRFKDGYGPVGAWFLLFKAKTTNALGEDYIENNKALLDAYPPYGQAKVPPACLRNHLMLEEMRRYIQLFEDRGFLDRDAHDLVEAQLAARRAGQHRLVRGVRTRARPAHRLRRRLRDLEVVPQQLQTVDLPLVAHSQVLRG